MNYNKLNMDEMKKLFDEEVNKKKSMDDRYVNIADNATTKVRILPSNLPGRQFFVKSGFHKVGEEYVTCPKLSKGLRCPICEKVAQLYKSKDAADLELARMLKAKKKFYFNAIVRGEEDKGVRILTTGIKLYEKILSSIVNPEIGDITDPINGYDFNITKKMKGEYWNYDDSEAARKQSKLSEDQNMITEWINKQQDLESQVSLLTYDELKKKLVDYFSSGTESVETVSVAAPAIEEAVKVKNVMPAASNTTATVAAPAAPKVEAKVEATKSENSDEDLADFVSKINKLKEEYSKE